MATHKLTRKEMKHDGFLEWTAYATDFLQENVVKIGVGLLIVVVVLFGMRFIRQGQERAAQKASYLLYRGEAMLQRGAYPEARQTLQELRDRFGGSRFARQGAFDLAQAQTALGENDGALATIEKALRDTKDDPALGHALLMLKAAVLGSMQRFGEAQTVCRDILRGTSLAPRDRYDATLLLADMLRLDGKIGEATELLLALQQDIDSGRLDVEARDLETRIQFLKALTG